MKDSWAPRLENAEGPKYKAIADAIARDIANATLPEGTRLPPQRILAWKLGVTIGTITRAYQEAERRELVSGEVGRGTFVLRADQRLSTRNAPIQAIKGDWWSQESAPPGDDLDDIDALVDASVSIPPPGLQEASLRAGFEALSQKANYRGLLSYRPEGVEERAREAAVQWFARRDVHVDPDDVMLVAGAHFGLFAALSSITRQGGRIATERLCYSRLKNLAQMLGFALVPIDMDDDGVKPDHLDHILKTQSIDAVILVPTLQNPTTITSSMERRVAIAGVLERHGTPLIEDDIYGLLPENAPPPISTLIPDLSILVTSISKTVGAGFRVGYLVSGAQFRDRLRQTIRTSILMVSPLNLEIASEWIFDGTAERILLDTRSRMKERRAILEAELPDAEYDMDEGALHAWLHLPDPWRSSQFVAAAKERDISLTPAHAFTLDRSETPFAVRLCVGFPRTAERLRHGLRILGPLLKEGPADNSLV